MDLPTPVNFRTSQPNAASIVGAAPQKSGNSQDQARFEQHLNDTSSQNNQPSAADRRQAAINADRRNNSSSNDQIDTSSDTQSASNDTTTQAASTDITPDQTDSSSTSKDTTPSDAQKQASDSKAKTSDTAAKDTTDTVSTTQTTAATDETKAAPTTDPVAEAAKEAAGATKTDDQKQSKTTDKKPTDLAALATAPVQVPNEQQKPETKPTETPAANTNAPIAPSETPLAAAAANATPKEATNDAQPEDTNPDAKLTITAKDGLGHEAAAKMADKTDAKANAAQQAAAHTNAQSPNAAATSTATQNFAKMVAAASGGDSSSVSATGSTSSNGTALNDLQSVGNATQSPNTPSVTVRVGTLPGQSTPTQIPAMTIALQVARNLQKGINRFDIRLDPAEMGKIDVRMEVKKDGNVAAHLMVERPETLQLLRRDASALQQALNNAGLQANADSLSFSLQDNNAGNQAQNFAGQSQSGSGLTNLEPAKDEISLSPIYNVNLSASGGIDIRI